MPFPGLVFNTLTLEISTDASPTMDQLAALLVNALRSSKGMADCAYAVCATIATDTQATHCKKILFGLNIEWFIQLVSG